MHDTSYLVPPAKYPRVVAVNARGADGKFVERPMPATLPAQRAGDGGLYGTASDYGLFLRMLLNRGTLGEQAHPEREVREDDAREPDAATSSCSRSSRRTWRCRGTSRSGAGKDHWGLGFQLAAEQLPNRRSPAAGHGPASSTRTSSSIRAAEIGVVVMMQTLPFYDEASMKVYAGVEEAVYKNLK